MADERLGKVELGSNGADGKGTVERGQHDPQPRWIAQQSEHVSQVRCLVFCQRCCFDGHSHSLLYMNRCSYGDIFCLVKAEIETDCLSQHAAVFRHAYEIKKWETG